MQHYIKVYLDYFDYGEQDVILCEKCGARASDIHHIYGRSESGDVIENLIALCRPCHSRAHASTEYFSKEDFYKIHSNFIRTHEKRK
jgi:hypothetical protein